MILLQFEQRRLFGVRLCLRLAQRHQIAPQIAAAIDVDKGGLGLAPDPETWSASPGRGASYADGSLLLGLFRLQRMQMRCATRCRQACSATVRHRKIGPKAELSHHRPRRSIGISEKAVDSASAWVAVGATTETLR